MLSLTGTSVSLSARMRCPAKVSVCAECTLQTDPATVKLHVKPRESASAMHTTVGVPVQDLANAAAAAAGAGASTAAMLAHAAAGEAVCSVIAEAKEVATVRHAVPGSWCSALHTVHVLCAIYVMLHTA
jgi:hypothetical protein